jgi:hypothetical protein
LGGRGFISLYPQQPTTKKKKKGTAGGLGKLGPQSKPDATQIIPGKKSWEEKGKDLKRESNVQTTVRDNSSHPWLADSEGFSFGWVGELLSRRNFFRHESGRRLFLVNFWTLEKFVVAISQDTPQRRGRDDGRRMDGWMGWLVWKTHDAYMCLFCSLLLLSGWTCNSCSLL